MTTIKTLVRAAPLALCCLAAQAQVPIDLSASQLTLKDSQTIRINNLFVPGFGSFQLDFKWNPAALSFFPDVTSMVPNGPYCEAATLNGNVVYAGANAKGYVYRSRTTPVGSFGAVTASNTSANLLTVSWAKTAAASDNPYLVGKTLTSFDPTHGYGMVGNVNTSAYPFFASGTLVEVFGGLADGAITIKAIGGSASAALTVAAGTGTTQTNCQATATGVYSGNVVYALGNANAYSINVQDTRSGSITAVGTSASLFTVTWDASVSAKPGTSVGVVGNVNTSAYPFIGSPVFVTDVGNALTFTSASGTAVFFR